MTIKLNNIDTDQYNSDWLKIDFSNGKNLTKSRTCAYSKNDEPDFYFKSEDIYNILETDIFEKRLKFDSQQVIPLGAKTLGKRVEMSLYNSLQDNILKWLYTMNTNTNITKAKMDLKSNLIKWQVNATKDISNDMQTLFEKGLKAGVAKSGVKIDKKYYGDVTNILNKSKGIIPAIENFQNQMYDKVNRILIKNYNEVKKSFDLDKINKEVSFLMGSQRYRTELMIKSEIASLSNYGMLKAWENDPDRNKYRYYWKSVIDDRTKPISRIRKQGNPYSFEAIKFLWEHQKQKINGHWENDRFFQRCGIARGKYKLDFNWKKNRFLGKDNEFKETL